MRNLYISKEESILKILNGFKENIEVKEFERLSKYINSFYGILKSDTEFKNKILSKCRG